MWDAASWLHTLSAKQHATTVSIVGAFLAIAKLLPFINVEELFRI